MECEEYEEDYQLLSLTHSIEKAIKEKIKEDRSSEEFENFKESLQTDLLGLAQKEGVDALARFNFK